MCFTCLNRKSDRRVLQVFTDPSSIAPRKVLQALQRINESHQGLGPSQDDPILGPLPGVPLRGRSLSDAFALAKGSESPPVVRENVSEFSPSMPREPPGDNLHVLIVDDNDINLKVARIFNRSAAVANMSRSLRPFCGKSDVRTRPPPTAWRHLKNTKARLGPLTISSWVCAVHLYAVVY